MCTPESSAPRGGYESTQRTRLLGAILSGALLLFAVLGGGGGCGPSKYDRCLAAMRKSSLLEKQAIGTRIGQSDEDEAQRCVTAYSEATLKCIEQATSFSAVAMCHANN
jgi:hypothetical protein